METAAFLCFSEHAFMIENRMTKRVELFTSARLKHPKIYANFVLTCQRVDQ